jgi:hypothetical protein
LAAESKQEQVEKEPDQQTDEEDNQQKPADKE